MIEDTAIERLDRTVVSGSCQSGGFVEGLEPVKLGLSNLLNLTEDGPLDSLSARRGGQRAIELPMSRKVEAGDEILECYISFDCSIVGIEERFDENILCSCWS